MGNRISIVFEETENRNGGDWLFNVFLDGISPERGKVIDAMTPDEQLRELSTAEFWALRCFQIVFTTMRKAGALRSAAKKNG